jgi:class 3 adenylate cyclase/tetratricopeptide (TPR) repeat protein
MSDDWPEQLARDIERISETISSCPGPRERILPGERRPVAALFLDLQGFTTLSERLDHEVTHRLVAGVMRALSRAVKGYGGYVDKYEGDLLMALFGATRAAEDDCARAVGCGLRMLRALEQMESAVSEQGISLRARVGIAYGQVTVAPDPAGHLTATGDAVNVASRLQEIADPGTVLVTEEIRASCGDLYGWKNLGDQMLRGRSQQVGVFRPTGPGNLMRRRWERAAEVARSPLVGRRREMKELDRMWELRSEGCGTDPRGGARHVAVILRGEAGVGKSRLMWEFLRSRDAEGSIRLLRGRTASFGGRRFGLWASLLRDLIDLPVGSEEHPDRIRRLLGKMVPELTGRTGRNVAAEMQESLPFLAELLSPEAGGAIPESLDEATRSRERMVAVRNLLRGMAGAGPVPVLALDDIQWLDEGSEDVLRFLTTNCQQNRPLLFLCAARPEVSDRRIEELFPRRYVETAVIDLQPLDPQDCAAVVRAMLRGEVGGEAAGRLFELLSTRSSGIPFYLEELVLELIETGVLEPEDSNGWTVRGEPENMPMPSSVSGLVCSRLDRLEPVLKQLLQYCSVLGTTFGEEMCLQTLRRLSPLARGAPGVAGVPEDPGGRLRDLCRRGFLEADDQEGGMELAFRHELLREQAYETMLMHNRAIVHRCAAEALQDLGASGTAGRTAEIAEHYRLAGDEDSSLDWGIRALREESESFLMREAARRAESLAAELETRKCSDRHRRELFEVLLLLLDARKILGRKEPALETADRLLEVAEDLGSPRAMARALYGRSEILISVGRLEEAAASLRRALDGQRPADPERYRAKLAGVYRQLGEMDRSAELLNSSLEMGRRAGNTGTELAAVKELGIISVIRGKTEEGIDCFRRVLQADRERGDRIGEETALVELGIAHARLERFEEAERYYHRALEIQREIGHRRNEGLTLGNLGVLLAHQGRFEEALTYFRRGVGIHREVGDRVAESSMLANIALAQGLLGDLEAAIDGYHEALELVEELSLEPDGAPAILGLRETLLDSGVEPERIPLPRAWPPDVRLDRS